MHGFRYPYSEKKKYAIHILSDQFGVGGAIAVSLLWIHLSCRLTA